MYMCVAGSWNFAKKTESSASESIQSQSKCYALSVIIVTKDQQCSVDLSLMAFDFLPELWHTHYPEAFH